MNGKYGTLFADSLKLFSIPIRDELVSPRLLFLSDFFIPNVDLIFKPSRAHVRVIKMEIDSEDFLPTRRHSKHPRFSLSSVTEWRILNQLSL
jgi:hypothetical protein